MGATIDSDDGAMIVMPSEVPAIKEYPNNNYYVVVIELKL